ncbi:hypothetical protein AB0K92_29640 [Streptomyces sp. NPDC052687]|uniref:hypothetical protein n=1 Tax=Streptomyces sp. NPDC052687 TaxID=3154759 RepID=UPI00342761F4
MTRGKVVRTAKKLGLRPDLGLALPTATTGLCAFGEEADTITSRRPQSAPARGVNAWYGRFNGADCGRRRQNGPRLASIPSLNWTTSLTSWTRFLPNW